MPSIEVEYGYGNSAKGGRNLPLNVVLKNDETEQLSGTVEILTRQSDNAVYAYDYPLKIASGGTFTSEITVPIGAGSDQLAVRVLREDGSVSAMKRVKLNISTTPPEIFIGLLSDKPMALQYFNEASVNYGQLRTRAFSLRPEEFPVDRARLDMLDVIVVSSFRMSDLTVDQTRALMQWMREGGVLLLGTGERVDDTLGQFAPEFLEDMYEPPVLTELSMSALQSLDAPGSSEIALPLVTFTLHGGSTVMSADTVPLISAVNKGTGILAVASFDFTDTAEYAAGHSSFTDVILTRTLGENRLDRLVSEAYGTEYDEYWSAQSLIDAGVQRSLPQTAVFGGVLALYLLLLGPVLWMLLKRAGRTILYRRIAAVLSLVTAGILYAAGNSSRLKDTFCTYARIREAGEATVNETAYLNLRNPYTGSYQVMIPVPYTVTPLTNALNQGRPDTVTGEEEVHVRISGSNLGKQISVTNAGAFESSFFRLEKSGANREQEGFSGSLFLMGNECSGTVKNMFPFRVKDAAVCLHGKVISLGTLEPGEEVETGGFMLYHTPLNDNDNVASFLTGVFDGSNGLRDHIEALERANFLSFYLSDAFGGYTADARVIGFAEDSGDDLVSGDMMHSGMTLLTSTIPVEMREGGMVCRSMLSRTPEVISGDYIQETNSCYRGDPVVLGYLPGFDIRIKELYFEEPDILFDSGDENSGTHSFRGTISLYNYGTGNFDELAPEQRSLSEEELSGYLSPDNMLTVRYTDSGDPGGNRLDTALPIPYVIGEEN
ncbi:MAG: hypothetical protein IJT43_08015 [Stomatobaculum sp.]|nr:hypothetical protein [Stomatobaculum sp.]